MNSYFATKCEKIEAEKAAEVARERSRSPIEVEEAGSSLDSALRSGVLTTQAPEQLTFVTWNIDGLDKRF